MAAKTFVSEEKCYRRFSSSLSSAALEWLLMALLFLDALYSYLVTKLARLAKLRAPCPLCSRLDHILGNEKPGFYKDLICKSHKSEISSLAFCHVHQKLADAHEMCDSCLLSFVREKKSNLETYRSLVGILGTYLNDEDAVKAPLLEKNYSGSLGTRNCSCCSILFSNRSKVRNLLRRKAAEEPTEVASENEKVKSFVTSPTYHHHENPGFDRLSHVGYSELNITSDTESEVQLLGNEDQSALLPDSEDLIANVTQPLQAELISINSEVPPANITVDLAREKCIHLDSDILGSSFSFTKEVYNLEDSSDLANLAPEVAIDHGVNEPDWCPIEVNANPPASSDAPVQQVPSEVSDMQNGHGMECVSATKSVQMSKDVGSYEFKISQNTSGQNLSIEVSLDLNDAYRIAVGSKGNLASASVTDVVTRRDSSRVHEDLRLLFSQISCTKGFEFLGNDITPSPRLSNASSSAVLENITKRFSIERNESGLESLDGSIVSEIEGESPLDRLKRQIELDRKSISALYKELEEERNASAVAAHQAMAMITRLQEEKASMQMEALQYQRMMEEQAEYDQEALQEASELLSKREKEIRNLESELESYRKRYEDEEEDKFEEKEILSHESTPTNVGLTTDPLFDFENEKLYISESLKRLEKRLRLFSDNGIYVDPVVSNGILQKFVDGQHFEEEISTGDSEHAFLDTDSPIEVVHSTTSPPLSPLRLKVNHTKGSLHGNSEDNNQSSFMGNKDDGLTAFEKEILNLNERLKTLEADRDFLEHAINSLRDRHDGVQFIQEIACHLRELRKVGISR